MGVKLNSVEGGSEYHKGLEAFGGHIVYRFLHPWLYPDIIYKLLGYRRELNKVLIPLHTLTRNVINKRREQFNKNLLGINTSDEKENV